MLHVIVIVRGVIVIMITSATSASAGFFSGLAPDEESENDEDDGNGDDGLDVLGHGGMGVEVEMSFDDSGAEAMGVR